MKEENKTIEERVKVLEKKQKLTDKSFDKVANTFDKIADTMEIGIETKKVEKYAFESLFDATGELAKSIKLIFLALIVVILIASLDGITNLLTLVWLFVFRVWQTLSENWHIAIIGMGWTLLVVIADRKLFQKKPTNHQPQNSADAENDNKL